jgi:hypothetical protein
MSPLAVRRRAVAGALGLTLFGAGCAALLETAAEEIAGDSSTGSGRSARRASPPTELERTDPRSGPPLGGARAGTMGYQAGATIDWTLYRFGPPFSVSRQLFERPASTGQVCRAAPFGLARDLAFWDGTERTNPTHGDRASASRPFSEAERSERELMDNSVRLSTLFGGDDNALAAHYIASAGRLGQQGHVCSQSLFVHVWIFGGDPVVTILR